MATQNTNTSTHTSLDQTQNPSNVYYIHPSDLSTLKLVNVPFNGIGFADWKRSIIIGLVSKTKWLLWMEPCLNYEKTIQTSKLGNNAILWS